MTYINSKKRENYEMAKIMFGRIGSRNIIYKIKLFSLPGSSFKDNAGLVVAKSVKRTKLMIFVIVILRFANDII